jgi:hypothetical protein
VKSVEQLVQSDKAPAPDVVQQVLPVLTNVQTALARGRRRLDAARRAGDLNAIRAAAQVAIDVRGELDKVAAAIGVEEGALGVPDPIMEGARHYFDGRYREAVNTLTEELAQNTRMPLQAHVYVLRSAALFALYVLSGEADDSLRAQARRDAEACLRLDPAFQPNPAAFAPRFISFFLANDNAPQ